MPTRMLTGKFSLLKEVTIFLLLLSILLGIRSMWQTTFSTPEHPPVTRGVIDLRGWDFERSPSIPLNGEWEFYPHAFLSRQDKPSPEDVQPRYVQVPGDWSDGFSEEASSSYGYGTYRIRILVDQPLEQPYTFWFQQI
ncbi:hypothetical protein [Brevibacillus composti]|uniref:hypothetical protein n=1 Tax=Brevibacillus composti TaxID=2796470 RepID=UPI002B488360|nr:hypothetical protein [Brevibacillus composti]